MRKLGIKGCYLVTYSASRKDRIRMAVGKGSGNKESHSLNAWMAFRAKQALRNNHPLKLRSVNTEGKDRMFLLRYLKDTNPCRGKVSAYLELVHV